MTREKEEDLIEKVGQLHSIIATNGLISKIKEAVSRIEALEQEIIRAKITASRWRDAVMASAGVIVASTLLLLSGSVNLSDLVRFFG